MSASHKRLKPVIHYMREYQMHCLDFMTEQERKADACPTQKAHRSEIRKASLLADQTIGSSKVQPDGP